MSGYAINEVHVQQYDGFSGILTRINEGFIRPGANFGFRGQVVASWDLAPSFSRWIESIMDDVHADRNNVDRDFRDRVERKLYERFKENLILNGDLARDVAEAMDLRQYGQHFGLPSPYLDWSYSPYVALFFALERQPDCFRGEKRCLYILDRDVLDTINDRIRTEVWPRLKDKIQPEERLHQQIPLMEFKREINAVNRRLGYQQGFFTRHVFYRSFEVWAKRIAEEVSQNVCDRPLLTKLEFRCDGADRLKAMEILERMNIHYRSLFPDIEGSVKGAMDSVHRQLHAPSRRQMSFWRK